MDARLTYYIGENNVDHRYNNYKSRWCLTMIDDNTDESISITSVSVFGSDDGVGTVRILLSMIGVSMLSKEKVNRVTDVTSNLGMKTKADAARTHGFSPTTAHGGGNRSIPP